MHPLPIADAAYLDDLYARFLKDPRSVDPSLWAVFAAYADRRNVTSTSGDAGLVVACERLKVAWRTHGHLAATLDPLGLAVPPDHAELSPTAHGITERDLDTPVGATTPRALAATLRAAWGGRFAAEVMHLEDPAARDWLISAVEGGMFAEPSPLERRARLDGLLAADAMEDFMNKRFATNKRFGLEGLEALIVLLEAIVGDAARAGFEEVVVAPMHRGRLTLITRVIGKPLPATFAELMGTPQVPEGTDASSDVPYHLGLSMERQIDGRRIKLVMPSNPSHVELVSAVTLGKTRAKLDMRRRAGDREPEERVLPLSLHTDGAFSGQGVISEMLQLASLPAYGVGGSVHVVVNNQLAFTVKPEHGRSSRHPSDVAKAIGAPILHVCAEDVDACARAGRIALAFRQRFRRDILVDIVGYRRRGHNELEEPMFTEPVRYRRIADAVSTPKRYADACVADGVILDADARAMAEAHWAALDAGYEAAKTYRPNAADRLAGRWSSLSPRGEGAAPTTGIEADRLRRLAAATVRVPDGFALNAKIERQWRDRLESLEIGETGQTGVTFATAEALAFASLLEDGKAVRLTGQDSRRGTFSQRHAVVFDQETGAEHAPLAALAATPHHLTLADSPLTEEACLAFEYGVSITDPHALVCWEAQFGDFANGAQAVIDQFIVAGDDKWLRQSGLVLMLPHGLEGGGPEHSSARPERFLQMAARGNISVVACGSPANLFHVLRRQILSPWRRPLVLLTPKSGLRHPEAVSALAELDQGTAFRPVIDDPEMPGKVRRVVLCAGKLCFELVAARRERVIKDISIVRVEELYPVPEAQIAAILERHPGAEVVWAQEEPENMGAWRHLSPHLVRILGRLRGAGAHVTYIGREAAPSPAVGWGAWHRAEQASVIDAALAPPTRRASR